MKTTVQKHEMTFSWIARRRGVAMQKVTSLRIMFPLDVKHCWMFTMKLAILFYGLSLQNHVCGDLDMCEQKKILMITGEAIPSGCDFPSDTVENSNMSGIELCFGFKKVRETGCCPDFDCDVNVTKHGNEVYRVALNKSILCKQHIVLMRSPNQLFNCMPSKLYNLTDFLSNLENCTNKGIQSIGLDDCVNSPPYDEENCKGLPETTYIITYDNGKRNCLSCEPPGEKPEISITEPSYGNNGHENAVKVMNNLTSLLEKMGNHSTAGVTIGGIKGLLSELSRKKPANIKMGFAGNGVTILGNRNDSEAGLSLEVQIPKEACAMAVERNATFAAIFRFPGIYQDNPDSYLVNNEMLGIEMGTEISNLSHSIDIHYTNVEKKGDVASCRSWNGTGRQIWSTYGCQTKETNDSVTCQCFHLTFFAILMSPPPVNMTAADYSSLTYITSIGCGLSMFFLGIGVFIHCVIRKGKASQATVIMINLFVAMFTMNLLFLVNESIAELENPGACMATAAAMHYFLLATFSWFFMEALHLCINLWKLPSEIKHYMIKICVAGWVTPAIVVIILLALKEYGLLVIHTNDGNSAKMCWITDTALLQWVNVCYYAIVFIFTLTIFIITVQRFLLLKRTTGKNPDNSCTKMNTFSILGLFSLLGITWAFAFFSQGPLLIPSYYIFTILNSFQGFFLFIYYYNSSKIVVSSASSSGSTVASDTVLTSPYH